LLARAHADGYSAELRANIVHVQPDETVSYVSTFSDSGRSLMLAVRETPREPQRPRLLDRVRETLHATGDAIGQVLQRNSKRHRVSQSGDAYRVDRVVVNLLELEARVAGVLAEQAIGLPSQFPDVGR